MPYAAIALGFNQTTIAKKVEYVNSTSTSDTSSSLSLTMPTVGAANLALLFATKVGTSRTLSTPSGWTSIGRVTDTCDTYMFYKYVTSADSGSSISLSWGPGSIASAASILLYKNVDASTPFAGTYQTAAKATASTTVTYPSITTTSDNATVVLTGAMVVDNNFLGITFNDPTGYTKRVGVQTFTAATDISVQQYDKNWASAGATGTTTGNENDGSSNTNITWAVALKVAP